LALNSPGVVFSDVQDIRRSKQMPGGALGQRELGGSPRHGGYVEQPWVRLTDGRRFDEALRSHE
jgi:hypothetical protein